VTDKEEMHAIASKAAAHRLSVTIHAIGDKAVHDVLDVYEAIYHSGLRTQDSALTPQHLPLKHRIEHVQVYHPADRQRLAELGVIASMQPIHATSDMQMADNYWGVRAKYSYALRVMLASGALLVLGSDCPVEPIDILPNIYAAITRKKPGSSYAPAGWNIEQCLSPTEAIAGFTLAAAQTSGLEDRLGSITAGKLADLTILDRDIIAGDPETILETQVLGTMVGGVFRYGNWV
jgi:predicted amidohydrolase YtcJ